MEDLQEELRKITRSELIKDSNSDTVVTPEAVKQEDEAKLKEVRKKFQNTSDVADDYHESVEKAA